MVYFSYFCYIYFASAAALLQIPDKYHVFVDSQMKSGQYIRAKIRGNGDRIRIDKALELQMDIST